MGGCASMVKAPPSRLNPPESLLSPMKDPQMVRSFIQAIDKTEVPMIGCNAAGVITCANKASLRLLGAVAVDAIVGMPVDMLIPRESKYAGVRHDKAIARLKGGFGPGMLGVGRQLPLQCLDGRVVPVWISVSKMSPGSVGGSLLDSSGEVYFSVIIDLSLQDAVSMKNYLQKCLLSASHDLRNVLTPLTMMFDLAENVEVGKSVTLSWDDAMACKQAIECALTIVHDAWALSMQAEDGIVLEKVHLRDLLHVALSTPLVNARKVNTKVVSSVAAAIDDTIFLADRCKICRVLLNLAGNAVKFTPGGTVDVSVTEAENGQILFCVKDDGAGMTPDALSRSNKLYEHADASRGGGSGVGLTMVEKSLGLMGATLHLSSEEGKGTRAWFSLPLQRCPR